MAIDRNTKVRILTYAKARSRRMKQPRQHRGLLTRAIEDVLKALLWGFHRGDGRCDPSYEAIAAMAECARSTVAEALKVLEFLGVLTWQHRIERVRVSEQDLFGRWAWRWRTIRTSNAYVLLLPSESENHPGVQQRKIHVPRSPLRAVSDEGKQALNKSMAATPGGDLLAARLAYWSQRRERC